MPTLSVEQHWAEKFHAFTRPRETLNSRVRDLVDLVLILEHQPLDTDRVGAAVEATFSRRRTHPAPDVVPAPPSDWVKPFAAVAAECGLKQTLTTARERVEAFWRTLEVRHRTRVAAYAAHPERFVQGPPRLEILPHAVWINPPATSTDHADGEYRTVEPPVFAANATPALLS